MFGMTLNDMEDKKESRLLRHLIKTIYQEQQQELYRRRELYFATIVQQHLPPPSAVVGEVAQDTAATSTHPPEEHMEDIDGSEDGSTQSPGMSLSASNTVAGQDLSAKKNPSEDPDNKP